MAEAAQIVEGDAEKKKEAETKAAEPPQDLADQPIPTRYFGSNLPSTAPGYQGVEPGGEYIIDAASQTWKDENGQKVKLPFDVPFVVKGKVKEGITAVQGRFVEFAKTPDCPGLFAIERFDFDWEDPPRVREIEIRPSSPARPIEKTEWITGFVSGDGDKRFFQVEMLPLRPNRFYCFQFAQSGQLNDADEKAVRKRFRVAIDQELRKPAYEGKAQVGSSERTIIPIATLKDYEEFRLALRVLLEDLIEPPRALKIKRGSFFDPFTPYGALDDAYKDEVDAILNQQDDAYDLFDNLGKKSEDAATIFLLAREEAYGPDDLSISQILRRADSVPRAKARLATVEQETGYDLVKLFDIGGATTSQQIRVLTRGLRTGEEDSWNQVFSVPKAQLLQDRLDNLYRLSSAVAAVNEIAELVGEDPQELESKRDEDVALADDISDITQNLGIRGTELGAVAYLMALQPFALERARLIDNLLEALLVEVRRVVTIGGSTVADYNTRAIWYMSADLGFGVSSETEDLFTYVGWNIYLRPVNKKALLSWPGRPFTLREEFLRRFSFTLGVVQSGFKEEPGRIEGVIGNSAALVGAGFRINDSLRLSVGGMVFEGQDPSPLISTTRLNWSPYVALSVDWNASKTFAKILP